MAYVVDANIAVKWFVEEEASSAAAALLDDGAHDLHAPDFVLVEVANVAWKKLRTNLITYPQAQYMTALLPSCFQQLHASADLCAMAFEISFDLDHPVYDCFYIACAQQVDFPLVTTDQRLVELIDASAYQGAARLLSSLDFA